MASNTIGRDATTGQFIPVDEAKRRPSETVMEKIKRSKPSPRPKGKPPTKKRGK